MRSVKDRKELLSLLQSVNDSNRNYFSKYGAWKNPLIKVFWLEINKPFASNIIRQSGASKVDKKLYTIQDDENIYWLDTADERIWQIYTFAQTIKTNQMIERRFTKFRGADRVWLTEKFMANVQKKFGFDNRGFGIKFKDILSSNEDNTEFSAKLWLGKSYTKNQSELLKLVKKNYSISTIRFGINQSTDNTNLSKQLYELYYNGHLTVTTCENNEDLFSVLSYVKNNYRDQIEYLEKEFHKKHSFFEVLFSEKISTDGFNEFTHAGRSDLKLWLHPYQKEEDLTRYSGVDMHTGDFVHIDISEKYSYVSADKKACMNVAPRFGTLASRYMSSRAEIFHDGVELFA